MGTDINMYAEKIKWGKWILAEPLEENKHYMWDHPDGFPKYKPKEIYKNRNRALFAILANVNNPAFSVEEYEFISKPRGLPNDVSQEVKIWSDWWGEDAFGHSWLLLDEMLSFDWNKTIKKEAMVSTRVAPLFGDGNNKFPFSQWPADEELGYSLIKKDRITVNWIETYAESAGSEFMNITIEKLKSFGHSKEVRIVFWFDN